MDYLKKLKLCFDTWASELEHSGFLFYVDGKFTIPEEQLACILNLNESCLALDGIQGCQGVRPSLSFYDTNLTRSKKSITKYSVITAFIGGSTAAGKTLPPHVQF